MKQLLRLFYWGLVVSLLGSLAPGVINLAAMQIAGTRGLQAAINYATGSMLAEIFIVRIMLSGMSCLLLKQKFFRLLEWSTAILLVLFSITCFITADRSQSGVNDLPKIVLPPFLAGLLLSILNPVHILFWTGWSNILMNKKILIPRGDQYNIYITGIGAGTMMGMITFIYSGQTILKIFQSHQHFINYAAGGALFTIAFLYIRKMVLKPVASRYAQVINNAKI